MRYRRQWPSVIYSVFVETKGRILPWHLLLAQCSLSLALARSLWTLMWLWLETGLRDRFGGGGVFSYLLQDKGEVPNRSETVCLCAALKYESQKRGQRESNKSLSSKQIKLAHKHTHCGPSLWPSQFLSTPRSLSLSPPPPSRSLSTPLWVRRAEAVGLLRCVWEPRVLCVPVI